MKKEQLAIIKKDIHSITSNKQIFTTMLVVPLVLTIIVPSTFVLISIFIPEASDEINELMSIIPTSMQSGEAEQLIPSLVLNIIMPVFFLMIPIMASSVMSASSFVGEKERHTLETLLYSPLSVRQLFHSKILAAFSVSMAVSVISFIAMITVLEAETVLLTGKAIIPDLSWIIVMLLISPSISLIAIGITVRGSAKAKTVEESQQRAVFLVLPVIALFISQVSGVFLLNIWILLAIGIVTAIIAALVMKGISAKITYEKLLYERKQ